MQVSASCLELCMKKLTPIVSIQDEVIKEVKKAKYLGVIIDQYMS